VTRSRGATRATPHMSSTTTSGPTLPETDRERHRAPDEDIKQVAASADAICRPRETNRTHTETTQPRRLDIVVILAMHRVLRFILHVATSKTKCAKNVFAHKMQIFLPFRQNVSEVVT